MSHSEFSASENASRTTPLSAARRRARRFVLQALYQWHVTKTPSHEILLQFRTDYDMKRTDTEYFRELLENIPLNLREIDKVLQEHLDHPLEELSPIDQLILRMAVYELKARIDVPYRVVLNEAVGLAKQFGPVESHKYINLVLDRVAQQMRQIELAHDLSSNPDQASVEKPTTQVSQEQEEIEQEQSTTTEAVEKKQPVIKILPSQGSSSRSRDGSSRSRDGSSRSRDGSSRSRDESSRSRDGSSRSRDGSSRSRDGSSRSGDVFSRPRSGS